MILQSKWQRCIMSLAPLAFVTGCATGPAPLTPEQQAQIAQEQTRQLKTQLTSMQLQGLMTILNIRDGLTSQEIASFAGDLFLTIRNANNDQKAAYNDYMRAQIQTLAKTNPAKAKQIAHIHEITENLELLASNPTDPRALSFMLNKVRGSYDLFLAQQRAMAPKYIYICPVKNPGTDPEKFSFFKITPEIVQKLNLPGPITEESVCAAVAKLSPTRPKPAAAP